ncbi:serine arginine repetitive matrix protein 1 [Fusarium langsethiae]|uniref:Serine arginine repetitive matrix protein 1 n=1 Tax=Fusarium langsethiae TaxID=179993 RepID=A0A0M9F1G0_FUSLA|nr:serine arginine repetitive matrix protein 1 [Fusarium langsethiae]GKU00633.1 unnamed protein product [Fusarium langsethiae]GKU14744.1 unnamed protein product [Fusarium langsethiae]
MATGVDARLLKSTKFPAEFSQKVDMQKVNLQVMKKWIASTISDILGNEDDVVIELVFNLIEGPRYPDIKSLQIQLTGFLDKDTATFCKDLWKLLLSAQSSPQGVPKELLEAKKLELMQEKIEADRAAETAKQRRDDWDRRDREVTDMKDRDRRDRAATRGDTWQGRRGDRDFDNRGRGGGPRRGGRRSRSPGPRFRDSRDSYGRDSYVPRGRRGGGRADHGRRKSPVRSRSASASSRSSSRSRSASRDSDQANRRPKVTSPGGRGDRRKRSRSPRGDSYRGRANRRHDRRRPSRPSRSVSSDRDSPAVKRRRYSSSRSRSVSRRRRSSRSVSSRSDSRSRSRSYSRSRSRSSSASPARKSKRGPEHGRGGQRSSRRRRESPEGRRRNSSSASSRSRIRDKSADVSEDESRAPPTKPEAEVATE